MTSGKRPNALATESSPYLLQHAYNPVEWRPWGDAAFAQAQRENKLVLVSIGYSACHWCHVMERESFEDDAIAALMNAHFVCIKVDREERPDVDQIYMEAIQLLSGRGGWPLNCITLPDGRPVYGGTYFPPAQWSQLLNRLNLLWVDDKPALEEQAEQLTRGLAQPEWAKSKEGAVASQVLAELKEGVATWKSWFDPREGGVARAPKFPLPVNWRYLLRYALFSKDAGLEKQVRLTLDKMAAGGIWDHLGGGFARYSTDSLWKVPHFEKMLYDNGQLLALYAEAYGALGNPHYREIALATANFVLRELTSREGLFQSALDADSEGEEGRYYVWSRAELVTTLGDRFTWFADLYSVNEAGFWEEGGYILLKRSTDAEVAARHGLSVEMLRQEAEKARNELLALRALRVRPGLDHKVLTAWNGLMIEGLAKAGALLSEPRFVLAAAHAANRLLQKARQPDRGLFRSERAEGFAIPGFLEDYAHLASGLIALYEATFSPQWLYAAKELAEYAEAHFSDEATGLFWFTSNTDAPLVARKMELQDNVIPASNSVMARVLFRLSISFDRPDWKRRAEQMLTQALPALGSYPPGHANWAQLALDLYAPQYQVSSFGPKALEWALGLSTHYLPHASVHAVVPDAEGLPVLTGLSAPHNSGIVVCHEKSCAAPVQDVMTALTLMPF